MIENFEAKAILRSLYAALQKAFRARGEVEVLASLRASRERLGSEIRRVSSYCLPHNLRKKSIGELRELAFGLRISYVCAESGDDNVLARVKKAKPSRRPCIQSAGTPGHVWR